MITDEQRGGVEAVVEFQHQATRGPRELGRQGVSGEGRAAAALRMKPRRARGDEARAAGVEPAPVTSRQRHHARRCPTAPAGRGPSEPALSPPALTVMPTATWKVFDSRSSRRTRLQPASRIYSCPAPWSAQAEKGSIRSVADAGCDRPAQPGAAAPPARTAVEPPALSTRTASLPLWGASGRRQGGGVSVFQRRWLHLQHGERVIRPAPCSHVSCVQCAACAKPNPPDLVVLDRRSGEPGEEATIGWSTV